jgi:hypothetical protein
MLKFFNISKICLILKVLFDGVQVLFVKDFDRISLYFSP